MPYSPPDAAAFVDRIAAAPCCAAITVEDQLDGALASRAPVVFVLRGNGLQIGRLVQRVHAADKLAAVHIDLVGGLRADRASVAWLAASGVDAVISSHGQLMAPIRHEGMTAILRLLLTRHSLLDTAVGAIARIESQHCRGPAGRDPALGRSAASGFRRPRAGRRLHPDVERRGRGPLGRRARRDDQRRPTVGHRVSGASRTASRLPAVLIASDGHHAIRPPDGIDAGVLIRDSDLNTFVHRVASDCPPVAVDIDSVAGLGTDEDALRFVTGRLGIGIVLTRRSQVAARVAALGHLGLVHVFAYDSTGMSRSLETHPRSERVGSVLSPAQVIVHLRPEELERLPRPVVAYGPIEEVARRSGLRPPRRCHRRPAAGRRTARRGRDARGPRGGSAPPPAGDVGALTPPGVGSTTDRL